MINAILSGDLPRSRVLSVMLALILATLALAPFLFSGAQAINTAAKVCVFIVLVASYDLLLGYTGIVSFAHTMFYGIGGYGVGLALFGWGATWTSALAGLAIALVAGVALAFLIGLFSLRVRAIFFAMVTLAVASAFAILAAQLSDITGGEDGRSFRVPEMLRPGFTLIDVPVLGPITGRTIAYYIVFLSALVLFLVALRIVNSPFGRVLQAIRENDFRAEALGYRTVYYRTSANCLAAGMAVLAGALNALWLRYTGPDTTLSFAIMLDILLMVVIGGMGTMYGAVIGATLFIVAQNYLQKLMATAAKATEALPLVPNLLHPDRWLLWLGVLFILSVYFFPTGIIGNFRQLRELPLSQLLCSFRGRIGRDQFWEGVIILALLPLGIWIVGAVAFAAAGRIGSDALGLVGTAFAAVVHIATLIGFVALLLAHFALSVKRFHDRGKSGWWTLIGLIPAVGWIWMLIELGFLSGDAEDNSYGPSPQAGPHLQALRSQAA